MKTNLHKPGSILHCQTGDASLLAPIGLEMPSMATKQSVLLVQAGLLFTRNRESLQRALYPHDTRVILMSYPPDTVMILRRSMGKNTAL